MERGTALKKLGKLLGSRFGYRINDRAPTPEEREAARAELPAAREERDRLKELAQARYEAILAADSEYQTLKAARKVAQERVDRLASMTWHYKITVGIASGICFVVKAEGDSWEEVLAKLAERQAA